jgi:excisionase family DNA binding protein
MDQKYFTTNEFAGLLRRSPATIRGWCAKNKLDYLRVGRAFLIPSTEAARVQREGIATAADEGRPR